VLEGFRSAVCARCRALVNGFPASAVALFYFPSPFLSWYICLYKTLYFRYASNEKGVTCLEKPFLQRALRLAEALFISLVFFIPKRYEDGKRFDVHSILFNFFKYSFQKNYTSIVKSFKFS
jgi:hypothetical protein